MFKYQVNVYRTSAGTVEIDAPTPMQARDLVQKRILKLGELDRLEDFEPHCHEYEVDDVDEMFEIDPVTGEKL